MCHIAVVVDADRRHEFFFIFVFFSVVPVRDQATTFHASGKQILVQARSLVFRVITQHGNGVTGSYHQFQILCGLSAATAGSDP